MELTCKQCGARFRAAIPEPLTRAGARGVPFVQQPDGAQAGAGGRAQPRFASRRRRRTAPRRTPTRRRIAAIADEPRPFRYVPRASTCAASASTSRLRDRRAGPRFHPPLARRPRHRQRLPQGQARRRSDGRHPRRSRARRTRASSSSARSSARIASAPIRRISTAPTNTSRSRSRRRSSGRSSASSSRRSGTPRSCRSSRSEYDEARRLARLILSDIVIYHPGKVEAGIRDDNFFEVLKDEIAEGRAATTTRACRCASARTSEIFTETLQQFVQMKREEAER